MDDLFGEEAWGEEVRQRVAEQLGLGREGLEARKDKVKDYNNAYASKLAQAN